jgi:hypothetical protein
MANRGVKRGKNRSGVILPAFFLSESNTEKMLVKGVVDAQSCKDADEVSDKDFLGTAIDKSKVMGRFCMRLRTYDPSGFKINYLHDETSKRAFLRQNYVMGFIDMTATHCDPYEISNQISQLAPHIKLIALSNMPCQYASEGEDSMERDYNEWANSSPWRKKYAQCFCDHMRKPVKDNLRQLDEILRRHIIEDENIFDRIG